VDEWFCGGEVDSYAQRIQAARAVSGIPGIRSVENHIRLRPAARTANPDEVRQAIEGALRNAAEQEAVGIQIHVQDSRVILEGKVRSWAEAHDAEEAAWAIPGVQEVENRLLTEVDI
jgi:osmotically-inducible protein OsmY